MLLAGRIRFDTGQWSTAGLSFSRDRAVHYGDGLFETIAVEEGQPLAWDRHIARLSRGCAALGIECTDIQLLQDEAYGLCKGQEKAVLKLIITRGEGGRGYTPADNLEITRILCLYDYPDYPSAFSEEGIEATICDTRLGISPGLAGHKHLNRLEQVLLRKELKATGLSEALVLDVDDRVIEGTMSNVFICRDDQLFTPDLGRSGVAGVVREAILELAAGLKLNVSTKILSLEEVLVADEIFFCNSIAGIWPVSIIDRNQYLIGGTSRQLQQELRSKNLIFSG